MIHTIHGSSGITKYLDVGWIGGAYSSNVLCILPQPLRYSLVALFLGLHCSSVACDEKLGGAWNEATSLEDLNPLGTSSSRGLNPLGTSSSRGLNPLGTSSRRGLNPWVQVLQQRTSPT